MKSVGGSRRFGVFFSGFPSTEAKGAFDGPKNRVFEGFPANVVARRARHDMQRDQVLFARMGIAAARRL
jgi:hypothetical protein